MSRKWFLLSIALITGCPKETVPPTHPPITASVAEAQRCQASGGTVVANNSGCRAKVNNALPFACGDISDLFGCVGDNAVTVDTCVCPDANHCWDEVGCKSILPPGETCDSFSAPGKESECVGYGNCLFVNYTDPDQKHECVARQDVCADYNLQGWSANKLSAVCNKEALNSRCFLGGDGKCQDNMVPPPGPRQRPTAPKYPNDPLFSTLQWNLQETTPANLGGANLPWAWAITTGNPKIVIAVADWAMDVVRPDFVQNCPNNRFLPVQKNGGAFSSYGHGTQVMSVVGRCTNNGDSLAGTDWHAQIFGIQFPNAGKGPDDFTNQTLADALVAVRDVRDYQPVHVVNMSIGLYAKNFKELLTQGAADNLFDAIGDLNRAGVVLVGTSGNKNQNAELGTDIHLPGGLPGIVTVGATVKDGEAADFSNWGKSVTIMAGGDDVYVTATEKVGGTSFSAPLIAGVASLALSVYPDPPSWNWKVFEYLLKSTARSMTCNQYCSSKYKAGPRATCKTDCCVGTTNICTAGSVDAYEVVWKAGEGLPNVPLIDAYEYRVVFPAGVTEQPLVLFNRGAADGDFDIETSMPGISVTQNKLQIKAQGQKSIRVRVSAPNITGHLLIKTTPYDPNDPRSDWIKIYVLSK